jgi:hypothetical protein
MNDSDIPVLPARAVRPTRCVYAREVVGRSKLSTQATSTKSTPLVTPYSLSPPLRCFRFRDLDVDADSDVGRFFDRFRLREPGTGGDSSSLSLSWACRCVEVTGKDMSVRKIYID